MAYYLYNGIKLPALPEVDEKYKYKVIFETYKLNSGGVVAPSLIMATEPIYSVSLGMGIKWTSDGDILLFSNTKTEWIAYEKDPGSSLVYPTWTNCDLYYTSGNLCLAASDPIPVGTPIEDPLSFMMGYQIGCRLRAQRGAKKPIGYLYNGVQLPALPEVDGFEYAYIHLRNDLYFLEFRENPRVVDENGTCAVITNVYKLEDGSWQKATAINTGFKVIWSNTDVYYNESAGGGLYMEASEPVPVYE